MLKLFQSFSKKEVGAMDIERKQRIVDYLKIKHCATVEELARVVFASGSTVRRDVRELENMGLVSSVYGGVVLAEYKSAVMPVDLRDGENSAAKNAIAERAAKLLFDGATIFMDNSSTVRRILKYADERMRLRVITNNLRIFTDYLEKNFDFLCTGGVFNRSDKVFCGKIAENFIGNYTADLFFFSSQALADDGEISDSSEAATEVRRAMLARAKKKVFLCDSSKLHEKKAFKLCMLDEVDLVIRES